MIGSFWPPNYAYTRAGMRSHVCNSESAVRLPNEGSRNARFMRLSGSWTLVIPGPVESWSMSFGLQICAEASVVLVLPQKPMKKKSHIQPMTGNRILRLDMRLYEFLTPYPSWWWLNIVPRPMMIHIFWHPILCISEYLSNRKSRSHSANDRKEESQARKRDCWALS